MQNAIRPLSVIERFKNLGAPSFAIEVMLSFTFFIVASDLLDLNFPGELMTSGALGFLIIIVGVWRALSLKSQKAE